MGNTAYYDKVLSLSPHGKAQQTVRCPFHEDSRRSLSINLMTGLWKCHAGCGSRRNLRIFEAKLEGVERGVNNVNGDESEWGRVSGFQE